MAPNCTFQSDAYFQMPVLDAHKIHIKEGRRFMKHSSGGTRHPVGRKIDDKFFQK